LPKNLARRALIVCLPAVVVAVFAVGLTTLLNSGLPIALYWRYLVWNAPDLSTGERLRIIGGRGFVSLKSQEAGASLWRTPIGDFWGSSNEEPLLEFLLEEQVAYRIYSNEIVKVAKGDVVLDVGSHLGVFTRVALNAGARKVVCFEPNPETTAFFTRTFAQEQKSGRVVLIQAAAMDKPGRLSFETGPSDNSGTAHVAGKGEISVEAVTIDQIVAQLGLDAVDFVKMDIEGAELVALKGARKTIERFQPKLAIALYHKPKDVDEIPACIRSIEPRYAFKKRGQEGMFYVR